MVSIISADLVGRSIIMEPDKQQERNRSRGLPASAGMAYRKELGQLQRKGGSSVKYILVHPTLIMQLEVFSDHIVHTGVTQSMHVMTMLGGI